MRTAKLSAEAISCMKILEIRDLTKLPLMKKVRANFLKLVKSKHPDGGEGTEEDFIELFEAKEFLLNYIKNNPTEEKEDEEESLIRRTFDQANIHDINTDSVTIKVQNIHVNCWRDVLEAHFGQRIILPSKADAVQFKTEN